MPRLAAAVFFPALLLCYVLVRPAAGAPLPSDVQILTREDFVGRPYSSVADALEQAIGVNVIHMGGPGTQSYATMRGASDPSGTLVTLDGRPLTHLYDGRVDLSQIPINIVERIEITRGGSSVGYGSEAVDGVINVITSRPADSGLRGRLGIAVGRDGYQDAHARAFGRSNLGDVTYLGSRQHASGFLDNEDHENTNHFANFSRSFNGKGYFGVEFFYVDTSVGLARGTPVPFDQWNSHEEQTSYENFLQNRQNAQHLKLDVARPMFTGTAYATYTRALLNFQNRATPDGPAIRYQDNRSDFGQVRWNGKRSEIGGDVEVRTREVYLFGHEQTVRGGAYAWTTLGDARWTVRPGLRLENDSQTGSFAAPRVAALYHPTEFVVLSASAQRARRTPNFEELFTSSAALANPQLEDETSNSYDAGVTWTPAPGWEFGVTGFAVKRTDRVGVDPATGRQTNIGDEKSRGVESSARLEAGTGTTYLHATLRGAWTFQKTTQTGRDVTGEAAAPMQPRHFGFVGLDNHLPRGITISNEIRYRAAQYETAGKNGMKIPSSAVWNVRLAFDVLAANCFFEARNLNRARYADTFGTTTAQGSAQTTLSPQAERTFWTGISILFRD